MKTETKLLHPIKFKTPKTHFMLGTFLFIGSFLITFGLTDINFQPSTKSVTESRILGESDVISEYKVAPQKFELPASKWIPQTFNNCGPAATAMLLQHYGVSVSQAETKSVLRTGDDDSNIFMYEISEYLLNVYGIKSKQFVNGNQEVVKTLIANGFYVLVEDWMYPNDDIGHVVILRGYDDTEGVFIGDDSYIGVGVKYPYEVFDVSQWKPFNRGYMPVYKPDQESLVKAIVGENWDEQKMYTNAVKSSLAEIRENQNDVYAWFNLGMSQYALGMYNESVMSFEKSRTLGWPPRMLWYQIEPIMAYNKISEYAKAIELADLALKNNDAFAEVHLQKAIAYKGLGDNARARMSAERVLELSPKMKEAGDLLRSL